MGWAVFCWLGSQELTLGISSQISVQLSQIGSLKFALMGAFSP